MDGNEYLASSGYLVLSDTKGHWTIGEDGILDRSWTKEKFEKFYPLENDGIRDRTKLLEFDPNSEVFQLATLIEESSGIQINYGKDNENVKLSEPLTQKNDQIRLLKGIQAFIAQFPDRFFKDTLPGVRISLTSVSGDQTGLDPYVLGVATFCSNDKERSAQFNIELTSRNKSESKIVQTLNHELGHVFDYLTGDERNKTSFTEVIKRLDGEPESGNLYTKDHAVTVNRAKSFFQYPDRYSTRNDMEYIGRLFEYSLTPGYEYLFEPGTFYREQAELALAHLIAFDPAFADLPLNFK